MLLGTMAMLIYRDSRSYVHSLTSFLFLLSVLNNVRCAEYAASVRRCRTDLPHTTDVRIRGDTCYQFIYKEKQWTEARDYCIQYGGRLVKIDDASTNDFILKTLKELPWVNNNGIWIGLNDRSSELSWRWATSSRDREEGMTWSYWGHGHPGANFHGWRDCIRMVRGDSWKWHETLCESPLYTYRFICEYQMPPIVEPPTPAFHFGKSTLQPSTTTTTTTRAPTTLTTTTPSTALPTTADSVTTVIVGSVVNSGLSGVRPDVGLRYGDTFIEEDYVIEILPPGHVAPENGAVMEFKGDDENTKKSKSDGLVAIVCVVVFLSAVFLLIVFLVMRRRRQNRKLAMLGAAAVSEESTDDEEGMKKCVDEKTSASDKLSWRAMFVATRPNVTVKKSAAEPNAYSDVPRRSAAAATDESGKKRSSPEELLPEPPQPATQSAYIPMFGGSPYDKISSEQSVNTYVPMNSDLDPVSPTDVRYANGKSSSPDEKYENSRVSEAEMQGNCSSGDDENGMGSYDSPKPTNIYAEIPGSDRHEEEGHIYECLDEIKLRVQSETGDLAEA